MYFFYHRVNNWNQSRESETWNEKAERRRVREVTVSYFLWDAALISLHLEAVGGSQITSCSTVLHKPTVINVFAHKSVLLRRKSCRCATNSDHNVSFFVRACVFARYFCWGFALCCMPPDERWPDRLSHVTYLETGKAVLNPHCKAPSELREYI